MSKIVDFFSAAKYILKQQQKITALQADVEKLKQQNDSMRTGMRRCVTCEYRIDFKKSQDHN
jgi:cell division protein FtsB